MTSIAVENLPAAAASFVHPTAVVDEGAQVGAGCRIWHFAHLMPGCELGEGCNIGQGVFIAGSVRLGRNVKVQNNVSLYDGVVCGDDVFLGPSCVFTNVRNPRAAIVRRNAYTPTYIGRGVTVGANATIVCGITLGEYAFVGAGAVVTRDVPPYALVLGTPARVVGWMSLAGHRLDFDPITRRARCPEGGEEYILSASDQVQPVESLTTN
jgi:UDP-2-acetamido-3-amino-2,3-dideoxy-glucuronate N-acetyltransferase